MPFGATDSRDFHGVLWATPAAAKISEVAVQSSPKKLSGEIECDEVYVVARHRGNSVAVGGSGRQPRCNRLKDSP